MSALAKNNLRCVVLNFLQPVHLITVDVSLLYRAISYYGHGQCTLYRAMSYYGHGQCTLYRAMSYYGHGQCSLYRAMSYYGHGHGAMCYYGPCERRVQTIVLNQETACCNYRAMCHHRDCML